MTASRIGGVVRLGLAVAALVGGGALVANSAGAAIVPQTGADGLLRLEADPYPADHLQIARGERLQWPVTAHLDAPTAGELSLELSAADPLATDAAGLRLELRECPVPWSIPGDPAEEPACGAAGERTVVAERPFAETDAGRRWQLGAIRPGVPRHFLATLSLPLSTPGALAAEHAEIGLGFRAGDVEATAAPPTGLAATGAAVAGPLMVALGVVLAGSAVLALRRRA